MRLRCPSIVIHLSYPLILQFGRNLYADASYASRDFYTAVAGTQAQIENIEVGKVGLRGAITDNFINGGACMGSGKICGML